MWLYKETVISTKSLVIMLLGRGYIELQAGQTVEQCVAQLDDSKPGDYLCGIEIVVVRLGKPVL